MKRLEQAMLWGAERGTDPLSALAARFPEFIGARIMGDVIHRWYRVDCVDNEGWPEFPGDPDPEVGALPVTFKRQSVLEVPRDNVDNLNVSSLDGEGFWPAAAYRLGKSTLAAPISEVLDSPDVVRVGLGQGREPLVATLGMLRIESREFLPFGNTATAGELVLTRDLDREFPGAIQL